MAELTLTQEDVGELLEVLNVALYDTQALIGQSHDTQEIAAYKEHLATVRKWITRLSQQIASESKAEMYLCQYCGQHHPIGAKEFYCPLDPNRPKQDAIEYNRQMDERNRIAAQNIEKPWLPLHDGE